MEWFMARKYSSLTQLEAVSNIRIWGRKSLRLGRESK